MTDEIGTYFVEQTKTFENALARGWYGRIAHEMPKPSYRYPRPLTCVSGDAAVFEPGLLVDPSRTANVWVMGGSWSDLFQFADLPETLTLDDLTNLWFACVEATFAKSYTEALIAQNA